MEIRIRPEFAHGRWRVEVGRRIIFVKFEKAKTYDEAVRLACNTIIIKDGF